MRVYAASCSLNLNLSLNPPEVVCEYTRRPAAKADKVDLGAGQALGVVIQRVARCEPRDARLFTESGGGVGGGSQWGEE